MDNEKKSAHKIGAENHLQIAVAYTRAVLKASA